MWKSAGTTRSTSRPSCADTAGDRPSRTIADCAPDPELYPSAVRPFGGGLVLPALRTRGTGVRRSSGFDGATMVCGVAADDCGTCCAADTCGMNVAAWACGTRDAPTGAT